jgi:membrane fusion protein, multidrug efflux system
MISKLKLWLQNTKQWYQKLDFNQWLQTFRQWVEYKQWMQYRQWIIVAVTIIAGAAAIHFIFGGDEVSDESLSTQVSTAGGSVSTDAVAGTGTKIDESKKTADSHDKYNSAPDGSWLKLRSGANEQGIADCLIEPHLTADVATTVNGIVKTVHVDRGDIVEKGQVIVELQSDTERISQELARTKMEFGRRKFERLDGLFKKRIVSAQMRDEAETEMRVASSDYDRATEALKMRTIRSPFDGVIVERYLVPGESVDQKKVVKIAQVNPLNVEVIASPELLRKVRVGMTAEIMLEGEVNKSYTAKVSIVDRVVDPGSGTLGIRLLLPNPKYRIPSGVKCTANFGLAGVASKPKPDDVSVGNK